VREETPKARRSMSLTKKSRQEAFQQNRAKSISDISITNGIENLVMEDVTPGSSFQPHQEIFDKMNEIIGSFKINKTTVVAKPTAVTTSVTPAQGYRFDIDCSALLFGNHYNVLTLQQRLNVNIYEPALEVWRKLRRLQNKKICMGLRTSFNSDCLEEGLFPDWSVTYNPPMNLMTSNRAKQAVVNFREEQARLTLQLANDLQTIESSRLNNEIEVNLTALKAHYEQEGSDGYSVQVALDALGTMMERAKSIEQSVLQQRWDELSPNPRKHLVANLTATTAPTPNLNAAQTRRRPTAASIQAELNIEDPDFQYPQGRPNRGQSRRGRGRGRQQRGRIFTPNQMQRGRGQSRVRGRGSFNQRGGQRGKNVKNTMKSMMEYIIQNM
jgi:hypothetical protein